MPSGYVHTYLFNVTGVTTYPSTNSVYSIGGINFTVVSSGSGAIIGQAQLALASSGTLTFVSGTGDASITCTSDIAYADEPYLMIRGLDEPDDVDPKPEIIIEYIDASSETLFVGVRRKISIDTQVVQARQDRLALLSWAACNTRTIDYNSAESGLAEAGIRVDPEDVKSFFSSIWDGGFSQTRRYSFKLHESLVSGGSPVRTSWPV